MGRLVCVPAVSKPRESCTMGWTPDMRMIEAPAPLDLAVASVRVAGLLATLGLSWAAGVGLSAQPIGKPLFLSVVRMDGILVPVAVHNGAEWWGGWPMALEEDIASLAVPESLSAMPAEWLPAWSGPAEAMDTLAKRRRGPASSDTEVHTDRFRHDDDRSAHRSYEKPVRLRAVDGRRRRGRHRSLGARRDWPGGGSRRDVGGLGSTLGGGAAWASSRSRKQRR